MEVITYSRQSIDQRDIDAVSKVLVSDRITQGTQVAEFEQKLARYCGAKYAVAVSSGTAALHLAVLAAGLGKGDEVITSPITFLATANCAFYVGATPVFADIDYETVNLDPKAIEKKITSKTKAIIPVDFAGLPAAMSEIRAIAKRRNLIVIEDASHALGAEYQKGKVGSCRFSDMTVFSFHPVKHITTGEGGAVTTNRKDFYEQLKALRSHGVWRTPQSQKKHGGWYYEMHDLGFNYRITDFQCALGLAQLKRIDHFLKRRRMVAHQYDRAFAGLDKVLRLPAQRCDGEKHAWHLYLLRLKGKRTRSTRRILYDVLQANGIQTQVHYIPIYRQPFYQRILRSQKIDCPNAERYYDEVLSLPLFPGLRQSELNKTILTVKNFFTKGKL